MLPSESNEGRKGSRLRVVVIWAFAMTASSLPVSPTPEITDESTLRATLACVLDALPIDMQGNHTPQTLYEILLWAASHHDTVNHACEVLDGAPSANDIRYQANSVICTSLKLN